MGLIVEASILVEQPVFSFLVQQQRKYRIPAGAIKHKSMEPALHEMGIASYLEEVRTGETRADMSEHVKTNVLNALRAK